MTNDEIQKLKDAGIDDATIQSIAQEDAARQIPDKVKTQGPVEPVLPDIDVTQPSETLKNAEAAGVPTTNQGSYLADAAALGAAAAPYALPATGIATGLYGAAKVGGWGREIGKGVQAMAEAQRASAAAQQATAQGLQNRFNQRMAQQAAQAARPVAPGYAGAPSYNVPTQTAPQMRAPMPQAPVAPQGVPAQAPMQQPSMMQRGMDVASKMRQFAAQRVLPAAVPAAVGMGGAAATSMAGNQMANMTPEQRKAYYDSAMMGAMSGDAGLAAAIMNRGQ